MECSLELSRAVKTEPTHLLQFWCYHPLMSRSIWVWRSRFWVWYYRGRNRNRGCAEHRGVVYTFLQHRGLLAMKISNNYRHRHEKIEKGMSSELSWQMQIMGASSRARDKRVARLSVSTIWDFTLGWTDFFGAKSHIACRARTESKQARHTALLLSTFRKPHWASILCGKETLNELMDTYKLQSP